MTNIQYKTKFIWSIMVGHLFLLPFYGSVYNVSRNLSNRNFYILKNSTKLLSTTNIHGMVRWLAVSHKVATLVVHVQIASSS